MNDDLYSNPDDAWDSVRVCRYHENCGRFLFSGGCDSCDCREEGLRHDERGEPYHMEGDAPDPVEDLGH